jgi:hypothetical protein
MGKGMSDPALTWFLLMMLEEFMKKMLFVVLP